jgi:hypothetical protein
VPAIQGRIFRLQPKLKSLSQQFAVFISIFEFSANPCEAIPAPHSAVVGFSEAVAAAGKL